MAGALSRMPLTNGGEPALGFAVRAATTANVTISSALNSGDTLDGVTLANGDLVLVKDQSTTNQNGIYLVGTTPVRCRAFDRYDDHPSRIITVQEGTTNADTIWQCTSNRGGTLGSTAIAFTRLLVSSEDIADTVGGMVTGNTETGITVTYQDADNTLDFELVDEYIADLVGTMVTGNTETNITVTYQDADNTLDFAVPAADDSTAGVIEVALGTEVESASSTTLAVTPGRMEKHPGVCKGWAKVTNLSTTPVKAASYNVAALVDNGTGDITVPWDVDMSSGDYDIQVTVRNTGGSPRIGVVTADAVGSARVLIQNSTSGAAVDNDFYIAAHGDQ